VIKVQNIVKRYGPALVVDNVSFEVEKGEIVGFLGPNGAGKTTTMRILTGYLPATAGAASIAGHDVFHASIEARRNIGYLPEGVPLYPEMRVEEYLLFRARIKGVSRSNLKTRLGDVLDRCGIKDVRRQLTGSLSKGYRQRVGLADALIHDPPVLILDEPTVGLDPNQIRQVRSLIRNLGETHTILLSTHILPEVEMVCERVLIIHQGRLAFGDSLENIAKRGADSVHVLAEIKAPANAADLLRRLPGVTAIFSDTRGAFTQFRLSTEREAELREAVGSLAAQHGWTIRTLRGVRPSLEDLFVRLTAEEDG